MLVFVLSHNSPIVYLCNTYMTYNRIAMDRLSQGGFDTRENSLSETIVGFSHLKVSNTLIYLDKSSIHASRTCLIMASTAQCLRAPQWWWISSSRDGGSMQSTAARTTNSTARSR